MKWKQLQKDIETMLKNAPHLGDDPEIVIGIGLVSTAPTESIARWNDQEKKEIIIHVK